MGDPSGRAAWVRRSLERRSVLLALALAVGASAGIVAGILGMGETALATAAASGEEGADAASLAPLVWAVAGVPIAIVALLGAAAVRELTRLLGVLRAGETAVIRSRGATRGGLVAVSAIETLVVSLPAAALGVGVAAGVSVAAGTAPPSAWLVVPIATVVAVAIAALGTRGAVAGAVLADRATSAGRVRRTVGAGGIILLAAAAAVAVWQSAISRPTPGSAPSVATQAIVAAAPALSLLTGALLVLVAVTALARALERGARGRRGLAGALLARRLARGIGFVTPAVLVIAFVAGMLVVAGAYGATWDRASTAAREFAVGADARVTNWTDDAPDGAARVLTAPVLSGDGPVVLVSIPSAAIPTVALDGAGTLDRAALADAVAPEFAGLALPDGTTAIELVGEATPGTAITLWIADPSGPVRPIRVEDGADLPAPTEGAVVVAVEIDIADAIERDVSVRLDGLVAHGSAAGTELPLDGWAPRFDALAELPGAVYPEAGIGVDVERRLRDRTIIRFLPAAETVPAPIALSAGLAARNALAPGDPIELRYEGSGRMVRGVVAVVVPAIPGAGTSDGVLLDLSAFGVQQLGESAAVPEPTELWSPEPVEGAVTPAPTARDVALGATAAVVRLGAIGGLALAAGAVLAIALALERARRREVALLRALGAAPGQQVAARAGELALALGAAAVGGALVGIPVAILTVPGLVRLAAPDLPGTVSLGPSVDPVSLGAGFGILVLALAGIVLATAGMVRRRAVAGGEPA